MKCLSPAALALIALMPLGQLRTAAADPIQTHGKVTAVTVYQGQALVTRTVSLDQADGLAEIVVTELPDRVVPGSLYAEPNGSVEVRSVRFRTRPVEDDTREEVRSIDQDIQTVQDEIAAVQMKKKLLAQRTAYLNNLEGFTTKTADRELQSGVLDATTLKELTKLVFEERASIAENELELAKRERELKADLQLLSRQRKVITAGSSRTLREAVVFVNAPQPGPVRLRLTYLVSGASWSPSYNLRASADRDKLTIEYNASVQQMSGEDWTDVAMTLSTASPSLVATAPVLERLPIRLAALKPQALQAAREQAEKIVRQQLILSKTRGVNFAQPGEGLQTVASSGSVIDGASLADRIDAGGRVSGFGGFAASYNSYPYFCPDDRGINRCANDLQVLEFNTSYYSSRTAIARAKRTEGVSVVYRLANRTSLPSRSDQQLIQIASTPVDGDFYRVATPVLTSYVYEEAKVTNETGLVLLAGPSATFLGDEFVGRGAVPTVAVGQSFTVGLGIDESLRARRELVNKTDRVQGGNRLMRFNYQLVIENFGDKPAKVRLLDRLPTEQGSDIKVSLLESDPDPVKASAAARKNGKLRWDVTAPAKSKETGEVKVDYALEIEYDKNRQIVGG